MTIKTQKQINETCQDLRTVCVAAMEKWMISTINPDQPTKQIILMECLRQMRLKIFDLRVDEDSIINAVRDHIDNSLGFLAEELDKEE